MFSKKKKNDIEDPIMGNTADEQVTNVQAEESADADSTPEEVQPELSVEEKLQQEVAALNDKYLRLFAEFDNYKRRTQKERAELLKTAGKDVIVSMLPVLDDFDRANKAMQGATDVAPILEGLALVHHKLKSTLNQKGLKEMETLHTTFDTDLHEAITNIPAPEELKGKVMDELEKGYTLNDKVIRFAKVVVGS
ncbi:nucleotide exchange factor GrpE [Pedobacter gandavensis]|uniref:nucleotide exchange factor GrpE n=1 Tax=Pedobacter gandavensis TaxID=2679963 RepID=UPI00292ED079|nr:nucleotide exchange factor GrpE [Pedobacter gandavensis]